MKKLLVLVLVFGMSSAASAALQISVNGDKNPVDSEIVLYPSDEIILDIWTDAVINLGGSGEYILVVNITLGSISGGESAFDASDPEGWISAVQGLTTEYPAVIPPVGMEGIFATYANSDFATFEAIPAGTVLADQILFTCMGEGDAVINLWGLDGNQAYTDLMDSVVIHQIPEPATMLLLGFGGLFLRRKK